MNPFEAPPSTPAVSFDPPVEPPARRRGRTVAVVLGTAGMLTAGIVGVSHLASADDPDLTDVAGADRPLFDGVAATDDEPSDETDDDAPTDDTDDDTSDEPGDDEGDDSGELRIQVGDGEPIVIDLGELFDGETGRVISECLDLPFLDVPAVPDAAPGELDLDLDLDLGVLLDDLLAGGGFDDELQSWLDELDATELGSSPFEIDTWDLGDQVTVVGDDGLTIIDLGDGDATVTIERDGETGELTITTDGTATERRLDELFGEFELPALPQGELPDLEWDDEWHGDWHGDWGGRLEECVAQLDE